MKKRDRFNGLGQKLSNVSALAVRQVLSDLGTHFSLTALKQFDAGGGEALVRWLKGNPLNPLDYWDANSFSYDYLAYNIFRKFPFGGASGDTLRKQSALTGFYESEEVCRKTNEKFRNQSGLDPRLRRILYSAQQKIGDCLASADFSVDSIARESRFGPGASYTLPRRKGDAYYKLGNKRLAVSLGCLALAEQVISCSEMWVNHIRALHDKGKLTLQIVNFNKVTTVPKDALTDRLIAIEPDLNMFIQRGLGRILRKAMKRKGIDLDYGFIRNRDLALQGSRCGSYATLDLSAASDTISYEVVRELLPPDVFDLFDQCRSTHAVLPSGTLEYQKFSSMGNGFTFELESLIFWALCSAAIQDSRGYGSRDLAVYGDDIVVPSETVDVVISVLESCGFIINKSKSFVAGKFRESCGGHYFDGHDVTPLYVKSDIDSAARYIWFANSVRRWCSRRYTYGCDARLKTLYDFVVEGLPRCLRRPTCPLFFENGEAFPDIGLGGDLDEVTPRYSREWQSTIAVGWSESRKTFIPDDDTLLVKALYSLECSASRTTIDNRFTGIPWWGSGTTPGQVSGVSIPLQDRIRWSKVKLPVHQWASMGPWI